MDLWLAAQQSHAVGEHIVASCLWLAAYGGEDKFSKWSAEGLARETVVFSRGEILHLPVPACVNQYHLGVVLTRAQTTVHGHTFYPLRHVGTRDAATDDTLEIDRQVKGHTVYEVGIGNDDILTPLAVGYRLFVHSASKVQSFFLLCSLF